ncbi:hypothetical protein M6B38_390280 [Iris pallida]|uniref:Uncharacterized protein n=1 Tax=Iris pallida TaxID=29817 RepID=A0AAX6G199_IRIPA|nr:hypothetical protein M6B38_390280 [Iris pallida]
MIERLSIAEPPTNHRRSHRVVTGSTQIWSIWSSQSRRRTPPLRSVQQLEIGSILRPPCSDLAGPEPYTTAVPGHRPSSPPRRRAQVTVTTMQYYSRASKARQVH